MSPISPQASLFPDAPITGAPVADLPPGFRFQAGLISPGEEAALAAEIAALELTPFEFRGYQGLRRVKAFGYRYDYVRQTFGPSDPIPDFVLSLRARIATFTGRPASDFVQVLTTEYAPGAPIGWHRDRPQFGDVVGVSLLSPCLFRLRRRQGAGWARRSLTLPPRSVYLMSGEVRSEWEHSIPPVEALRYSLTFRTLADPVR